MERRLLTIREARARLGISQAELGARVGLQQAFISMVENAQLTVPEGQRRVWEEALGMPAGRIYFPR